MMRAKHIKNPDFPGFFLCFFFAFDTLSVHVHGVNTISYLYCVDNEAFVVLITDSMVSPLNFKIMLCPHVIAVRSYLFKCLAYAKSGDCFVPRNNVRLIMWLP